MNIYLDMEDSGIQRAKEYILYNKYSEFVELFSSSSLSVNTLDNKGNSLLHHSSINNRMKFTKFLISKGAEINRATGPNQETPFIWALRSYSYRTMNYLHDTYISNNDDNNILTHKDINGNCPLFIAIKNYDINCLYLLLSWGADPDCTNAQGLTPLLYIFKVLYLRISEEENPSDQPKHHMLFSNISLCRSLATILLEFGANVHASDPENGNTVIHYLASHPGCAYDMHLNVLLLQASPKAAITNQKNSNNETPYDVGKKSNTIFTRFLFDYLLYQGTPYLTPTLILYVVLILGYYLLDIFSLWKGLLLFLIIFFPLVTFVCQTRIIHGLDRLLRGMMYATYTCSLYILLTKVFPVLLKNKFNLIDNFIKIYYFMTLVVFIVHFFIVRSKPPLKLKKNEKKILVDRIVNFCPEDGTYGENETKDNDENLPKMKPFNYSNYEDDENDEFSKLVYSENNEGFRDESLDSESHGDKNFFLKKLSKQIPSLSSRKRSEFNTNRSDYGDDINNIELNPLNPKTADLESASNPKIRMFPLICTHCHSDRRCCYTFEPSSKTSKQVHYDMSLLYKDSPVQLAYAYHCYTCNECIIDQDHHSFLTGQCIGRNNRFIFIFYCLLNSIYSLFIIYLIKSYQYYYSPISIEKENILSFIFYTEYKTLTNDPSFFITFAFLFTFTISFFTFLMGQATFIGSKTTMRNLVKGRILRLNISNQISNFLSFLSTGNFQIYYTPLSKRVDYTNQLMNHSSMHSSDALFRVQPQEVEMEEMER